MTSNKRKSILYVCRHQVESFTEVMMINLCYKINSSSKMLMIVATIVFLFPIGLRFPKSKSISDILRRRYSQSTLKKIRKVEKLDYRLRKAELDLEFLLRCRDSNVMPNFLNFLVSSHYLKASLTYRQYQLKLLQEEIRHKKSDIRVLKK